MGVEAPMLRTLTRRGCPSGARSAKRVPRRTPQPTRRRRSQQGWGAKHPNSRTSIRAIAALGPGCAARGACARDPGPSAAMARVDVLLLRPLWMRRGAQGLADQGSRLSERSETERVRARPRQTRAPQVAPERSAGDADSGVALSLVPFFRRRERKGLACRATPGLRPQPRHRDRFIHKLQQPQSGIVECRRSAIKYVAVKE